MTSKNNMRPVHPGEILLEEFLRPLEMSANRLAGAMNVPTNRLTSIINGERGVSADTALRLARALDTTPEFWMNIQQSYDLRTAEADKTASREILAIKSVRRTG